MACAMLHRAIAPGSIEQHRAVSRQRIPPCSYAQQYMYSLDHMSYAVSHNVYQHGSPYLGSHFMFHI